MSALKELHSPQRTQDRQGAANQPDLCLLALDGGGVRGLSSLFILSSLMTKINAEREKLSAKPVKPCQIFDMIGGTSTGGLLAILLGRLELEVEDCIALYQKMMGSIFGKKKTLVPVKLTSGAIQNRFDPQHLKAAIQAVLKEKGLPENEMYDNGEVRTCRTFVVARRMENANEVAIKDYTPIGEQNHDRATIVEAAMATSAASTFFPPVKVGNRQYVDGALGTNNPIDLLWKEAQDIWAPYDGQIKPKLQAIVSIGTGHPGLKKIENSVWGFFMNTLTDMITQTEQTARNFQFANRDLIQPQHQRQYFRFNVDHGLEDVGLEEHDKVNIIETATVDYLNLSMERKFEMQTCGEWLSTKECLYIEDFIRAPRIEALMSLGSTSRRPTLLECNECIFSLLNYDQTARRHKFNVSSDSSASWSRRRLSNIKEADQGTLEWLAKEGTPLQKWMKTDRGLFWIRGKAGSGKSVTMKYLYTKYKSNCPQDELAVGFFFTKLGKPIESRLEGLLRVLLAKILLMDPLLFKSIREYYRNMTDYIFDSTVTSAVPVEWTQSDLQNALKLVLESEKSTMRVALFVDAIDESDLDEEDHFVQLIHMLHNLCGEHFRVAVKVCFSSRTNPNMIDSSVGKIPGFTLEEQTANDIASHLTLRINEATIIVPPGQNRSELWNTFLEKADGCWLWVDYAVKVLRRKGNTVADLKREVEAIPKDLEDLFDTFLEAIDLHHVEETNRMLAIAFAGQGQLDVEDFRFAMALGSEKVFDSQRDLERQLDFVQNDFTMWSRIRDRCGDFLELRMQDSDDDNISRGTVDFYHSKVKDYLSKRAGSKKSKILPHLELLKQGNENLTRACLRYLVFPEVIKLIQDVEITGSSSLSPPEAMRQIPFLLYCTYFAFRHSCHVLQEGSDMAKEVENFWTPAHFDSWLTVRKWLAKYDQPLGEDTTLTALTILEGADVFVKCQIEKGQVDANETLPTIGHYLTLAALVGKLQTVQVLLDLKDPPVDIDAKGGIYCTALQAAASNGHAEIVRLLLDRGADPQITGGRFMSPLCAAAFSLSIETLELLLTHPRCNSTVFHDQWHNTKALEFASEAVRINWADSNGSKDPFKVVRLLAGHGFEYSLFELIDIPLALYLLSAKSTEVMQTLIRDTRYIDAPSSKGFTLLRIACADGTLEIVKMLVEKLVEKHSPLDMADRSECTPLHFATINESHEVLEYLLDQNHQSLDTNARDASGITPLHIAYALGSKRHVDLLVEAGADKIIVGAEQMTMLHFAMLNLCGSDHVAVLEELGQADVNTVDVWERTPLHIAAQYGSFVNVQWLLDHGADISLVDDEGRTALHAACQNFTIDSTAIIDLLVAKGLSLSTQDLGKRTPLHLAFYDPKHVVKNLCWEPFRGNGWDEFSERRCYKTVHHILEKDEVELNSIDNARTTPLHLACWRGLLQIILEMVGLGANIDATDSIGSVPLDLVPKEELRDALKEVLPPLHALSKINSERS